MKFLVGAFVVLALVLASLTVRGEGGAEDATIFLIVPDVGPVITVTVPHVERVPCAEGKELLEKIESGGCSEETEVAEEERVFIAPISMGRGVPGSPGAIWFPMFDELGDVVGGVVLVSPTFAQPSPSSKPGA